MDPLVDARTHDTPGCTGSWHLEALENLWLWRCGACRAVDFGSLHGKIAISIAEHVLAPMTPQTRG